jgi:hypothetical protein
MPALGADSLAIRRQPPARGPRTYPKTSRGAVREPSVAPPRPMRSFNPPASNLSQPTRAHTLELREGLPQSQLAVVPGTGHGLFAEKPGLCNQLVIELLTEDLHGDTR